MKYEYCKYCPEYDSNYNCCLADHEGRCKIDKSAPQFSETMNIYQFCACKAIPRNIRRSIKTTIILMMKYAKIKDEEKYKAFEMILLGKITMYKEINEIYNSEFADTTQIEHLMQKNYLFA